MTLRDIGTQEASCFPFFPEAGLFGLVLPTPGSLLCVPHQLPLRVCQRPCFQALRGIGKDPRGATSQLGHQYLHVLGQISNTMSLSSLICGMRILLGRRYLKKNQILDMKGLSSRQELTILRIPIIISPAPLLSAGQEPAILALPFGKGCQFWLIWP